MIGQLLWTESFQNRDWPLASAIAISLLVVIAVPILVLQRGGAKGGLVP
jgi:putrescine transport system permease protein